MKFPLSLAVLLLAPWGQLAAWTVLAPPDGDLYPSVVVATSGIRESRPGTLGDPFGQIGVEIVAPENNARVSVVIQGSQVIEKSEFTATLPKKGRTYKIYPLLNYDYDALLRVRQPYPETIAISANLDGTPLGTERRRLLIRSINDCPFKRKNPDGSVENLDFLFAAYVNENHPFVDRILREAIDTGTVDSLSGYQGSPDEVLQEMEAVWDALAARDFAYSSITRPSLPGRSMSTQHVRLIGDSIKTSQANCVDGSVLLASVFRKLGLDTFLVSLPGHMIVGAFLDRSRTEYACIETTLLGDAPFAEAVKSGNRTFAKHRKNLTNPANTDPDFGIINISDARSRGILPLREPAAER